MHFVVSELFMLWAHLRDGRVTVLEHIADGNRMEVVTPERWEKILNEGDLSGEDAVPLRFAELCEIRKPGLSVFHLAQELSRKVHSEIHDQTQGSEEMICRIQEHFESFNEAINQSR